MEHRSTPRTSPVQRAIRDEILAGTLPPGTPLRIASLADQYGVSYSVVREVLLRLEGQGLTQAVPRKGFTVTPVSRRDLLELTGVRKLVEGQAFRESIENGDVEWETRVVAAMHRLSRVPGPDENQGGSSEEWTQAHADFHHALISGCANRRLQDLTTQLRDTAEMYRQLSLTRSAASTGSGTARDLTAEHQLLADLALARDVDAGVAALGEHLQTTTDMTLARHFAEAAPSRDDASAHA